MKTTNSLVKATMVVLACLVVYGCSGPGKVTGGGFIASAAGGDGEGGKANFGFNAQKCDASGATKGHFNYHDKNAGVKMEGPVVDAGLCDTDPSKPNTNACTFAVFSCGPGSYGVEVAYKSTNPKNPGTGTAFACVRDNGQGVNATSADVSSIYVQSGPFSGYTNSGAVQGNIQAHNCDEAVQ